MNRFVQTNNIQLHYLDHPGDGPTLALMPGLTANAHAFDGLIQAGFSPRLRVLALDLRGRGLSDKPATGYSMADHAADVLGLLESLDLDQVILGGHSFGGLLSFYIAAHHPERVSKLVIIDAAGSMHPGIRELIQPSVDRLGKILPSWEAYLQAMKQMPFFNGLWDPAIESFYRADGQTNEDGAVQARSRPEAIIEAVDSAGRTVEEASGDYRAANLTTECHRTVRPAGHTAGAAQRTGSRYGKGAGQLSLY